MANLGRNAAHGQESWASFVLEHLGAESVLLRAGARLVPITGKTAHIPRVLTDGAASWTAEGDEITSSAPTGDELILSPKKIANVVSLSAESVADAPVDELDTVGNALTRSVAKAIDDRAFTASAVSAIAPAGLRSVAIPAQPGGVGIDNIIKAAGTIESFGTVASAIFIHPTDLTTLRLVKEADGSNRPVIQPDLTAGGAERIAGARIFPTAALPVGTALVADAQQIVVGIRRDVLVEFSGHAKFTSDQIAAKVTARVDWGWNDLRGAVVVAA